MSNPQVENGNFTRIHNEIYDAVLGASLSKHELICVLVLLRKTYGFQKTEDMISYSQFEGMGRIKRQSAMRALAGLVEKNIVIKTDNGSNRPASWKFNKYSETWATSIKMVTATSTQNDTSLGQTSTQNDTATSTQNDTHKRKKEITTKVAPAAPEISIMDSFRLLLDDLRTTTNRPAKLQEIYIALYGAGSPPDFGYLGKVAKQVGGAGRLAELLLQHCGRPPTGDVLAYIVAAEKRRKQGGQESRSVVNLQFDN